MNRQDTETHSRGNPRSQRCIAKSNRTGEPCKRWAVRGATVCQTHGAQLPVVRETARSNVILQKTLDKIAQADPGSLVNPWDALLKSVAYAHALLEDAREKLSDPESGITGQTMQRFTETLDRATRVSQAAITSRAYEKMAEARQSYVDGARQAFILALALVPLGDATGERFRVALGLALSNPSADETHLRLSFDDALKRRRDDTEAYALEQLAREQVDADLREENERRREVIVKVGKMTGQYLPYPEAAVLWEEHLASNTNAAGREPVVATVVSPAPDDQGGDA